MENFNPEPRINKDKMRVYLCGPINSCTDDEATTWRDRLKKIEEFEWVDPMKRDYRGVECDDYREIVELDKRDIRSCDFVVAMYKKPSCGTSMEIFLSWQLGVPVILINESETSKISPWLLYHSACVVDDLSEAIVKLRSWS